MKLDNYREQGEVTVAASVMADLLIYAERYALGRKTYAVDDVCRAIHLYKRCLSEKDKFVIIKDIKECKNFGMDMDKERWLKVLEELRNEQV